MGAINESVYVWDLAHDRFTVSESMHRVLGLPGEDLSLKAWQRRIHPEDFPGFRDATVAHLKGLTERFQHDYRYRAADGSWRWARTHGVAIRDKRGRALRMIGSTGDISELRQALQFQAASAEILAVISSSVCDTKPVFDKILDSCQRLFEGRHVWINLVGEDGAVHLGAYKGADRAAFESVYPLPLNRDSASGCAILERRVQHYPDVERGKDVPLHTRRGCKPIGVKSVVVAPLLWEGHGVGAIFVGRATAGEYSEADIDLLKTFADQAVIAIQNARLFNETNEALEQQTASAEVLRVISSSPADLAPVFEAVAQSVSRLCEAPDVVIVRTERDTMRFAASVGSFGRTFGPELAIPITRDSVSGRSLLERRTIQVENLAAESEDEYPEGKALQRRYGHHTMVSAPLLRGDTALGAIAMLRKEIRPFTEKQIALLRTFADQAAIAIENVRLFNETAEALDQQKASAEVLGAIGRSISDASPVFEKILESCQRLFEGHQVGLNLIGDDGRVHLAAYQGPRRDEMYGIYPMPLDRTTGTGCAVMERRVLDYPVIGASAPENVRRGSRILGVKSIVFAPLLAGKDAIGALWVGRLALGSFGEKQTALLQTFASQAVIAIQNARLFREITDRNAELKQALAFQEAVGEILSAISSSITDAQPVFDAIVRNVLRLLGAPFAVVQLARNGQLELAALKGEPGWERLSAHYPQPLDMASTTGRAILTRQVVQFADLQEDAAAPERSRAMGRELGYRTTIAAPLMLGDKVIGAIGTARRDTAPFDEKQVSLIKTFADQAVIAIENARLFNEIQEKSRQLEIANRHKSEFLANMSHELRTPLNAIIGFTRIVMRRSKEQLEQKQYENLEKILASGEHLLQLINAILDLSKVEAGRVEVHAADLQLGAVLEQCMKTVEPLVKAPAVRLVREFDGEPPQVYADEEKLRQIVLNLLGNAVKFTERGTVRVQARANGDAFSVAVADTGIGIPADKLEHVFDEFTQADASSTRLYGGTGLGLTIARRLARLMGGDIAVKSAPGVGSTFTLTLPIRYPA